MVSGCYMLLSPDDDFMGVAAGIIINNTQMEKSIASPLSEFLEQLQKFPMISCRSASSKVPATFQPSSRGLTCRRVSWLEEWMQDGSPRWHFLKGLIKMRELSCAYPTHPLSHLNPPLKSLNVKITRVILILR